MFSFKSYDTEKGKLIAACDHSLLGKEFKENKARLKVKESFYHKEKVEFKRIENELKDAKIANLVGKKLIDKLIEEKIINPEEVKKVEGTPHVQIFVLEK